MANAKEYGIRDAYDGRRVCKSFEEWLEAKSDCRNAQYDEAKKLFVLSDESTDRDGERLSFDGWLNEPGGATGRVPYLYGHDSYSMEHMLGTLALTLDETLRALTVSPTFVDDDRGTRAKNNIDAGMTWMSVGFIPYAWTDDGGKTLIRRRDGEPYPWPSLDRLYTEQIAIEGSQVPVPSNPNAHERSARGEIDKLREVVERQGDLLQQILALNPTALSAPRVDWLDTISGDMEAISETPADRFFSAVG